MRLEVDMQIQSIQNLHYAPSHKGVYFSSNGSFLTVSRKNIANQMLGITKRGMEYPKDNTIPKDIKQKFLSLPFINNLSKKFDVFIYYREHPNLLGEGENAQNVSTSKIIWTDYSKQFANEVFVAGSSSKSQAEATNNMFSNIEHKNFEGEIPSLQKIFI